MSTLPTGITLLKLISEDRRANGYGFALPGFQAVAVHRFGVWEMRLPLLVRLVTRPIYKGLYLFVRNVYGIELPRTVQVGRRLCIGHQSGIVIHPHAVIGDDCIIRFNSSLAGAALEHQQWAIEAPRLGNHVTLGAGAIVLGNVTIGDNVHIGPNAVVTTDVPPNTVVVVDPPRMIRTTRTTPVVDLRLSTDSALRPASTNGSANVGEPQGL
jgi:serine O-acetyltransferase